MGQHKRDDIKMAALEQNSHFIETEYIRGQDVKKINRYLHLYYESRKQMYNIIILSQLN